ncbi:type VII secretion protein EccB [Streptomyces sp. NPDC051636]|uniref:type VII secretion protein EccB n=1 Tax=Streptomyces sp. NPDC051636 TaxID=3365663 RepID=UPI00379A9BC4
MQNKRDQVQAHLFVMGRLASAMLRSDPDAPESPSGRTNRGAAAGVIIAVLVCAGAFVFGLIKPGGNDSWRTAGNLVVNKDTGARYLYLDGRLRPVRNYTSARLIAGENVKTTTVSTSSLAGTPHGAPVGIPGAPEELPSTADLDDAPWLVCSGTRPKAGGDMAVTTTLGIGLDNSGDGTQGRKLGGDEGLLIAAPDGTTYLLWQGSRLRLDSVAQAAKALGYGALTPRPASTAFVDAFPQGPDLAPPDIAGRGEQGPVLGGRPTRVGQIFRVDVPGSAARYHLLTKNGLVPLTATEAALVLGDPKTRQAYGGAGPSPQTLGADALTGHLAPPSATGAGAGRQLPLTPPKAVDVEAGSVVCANIDSTGGSSRVATAVLPAGVLPEAVQAPGPEIEPACLKVDAIAVRPGRGVLVRALSAGGSALGDTTFLVTDQGVKYRLLSQEAIKTLGFDGVKARTLPTQLLSMLPTGPDLTAESASSGERLVTLRCETAGRANRTKRPPGVSAE